MKANEVSIEPREFEKQKSRRWIKMQTVSPKKQHWDNSIVLQGRDWKIQQCIWSKTNRHRRNEKNCERCFQHIKVHSDIKERNLKALQKEMDLSRQRPFSKSALHLKLAQDCGTDSVEHGYEVDDGIPSFERARMPGPCPQRPAIALFWNYSSTFWM